MNIDTFIEQRRDRWRDLERLIDETEGVRDADIPLPKIQAIVRLYRQSCSDLNQARSYTANPELLDRLNRVTGRAYRFIYRGGRPERLRDAIKRLILSEILKHERGGHQAEPVDLDCLLSEMAEVRVQRLATGGHEEDCTQDKEAMYSICHEEAHRVSRETRRVGPVRHLGPPRLRGPPHPAGAQGEEADTDPALVPHARPSPKTVIRAGCPATAAACW